MLLASLTALFQRGESALVSAVEWWFNCDLETLMRDVLVGAALQERYGTAEALRRSTRGQTGNLPRMMIGVLVSAILGIGVVIPVILETINDTNISGTTALVVGLIPLMIGVLLIVAVSSPIMGRM